MTPAERWWNLYQHIEQEAEKLSAKREGLHDEWRDGSPSKERLKIIRSQLDIINNQSLVYSSILGKMEKLEES